MKDKHMQNLVNLNLHLQKGWLDARTERTIALICHWGVIEYLTGDDYDNCQMKVVDFNSMKRTGFMVTDEEFSEIFKEGERSVIQDVE